MMRDGVEYEDLLVIHEDIRKRLKGPKAPIGKSNPAIRPSSEQTPAQEAGIMPAKQRGSSAEGRRNLIRGVVELSRRPSPKARESLRKLARAYVSARRMGDIIQGMESSLGGDRFHIDPPKSRR